MRIYANAGGANGFYSFEGIQVTAGAVGSENWYQQYTCPITDGVITIPEVSMQTTTDSNVPNATYTAVFYNSAGRQMNTKLGNFFVDPQYLQSSVQSNIIVSGAGSTAANGTYTYRGQHNTRGYWNLFGQADSTTAYAIVWTGADWIMTNFAGSTLYTIDTGSQYPWDSLWTITNGLASVPAVAQSTVVVGATWAELTISNQGFVPNFWTRTTWDVQQIKQYINLIGNNVPWASKIVGGKTYLTRDPVLSTEPRAVASNDYDWLAINKTIYLDGPEYQGDLVAAIAGIGSTVCELRITSQYHATTSLATAATTLISFEGDGSILVSGGRTVTINSMREQPVKKIFYTNSTSDYVKLAFGAVNEMKWSWWGGHGTGSDDNHAFTQMFASLATNVGGKWSIQDGTFYCTNQLVPSHTHGVGTGSGFEGATFNAQGTVLRNSNPTGTDPIFKLHQGTVQVTLEDIAFDQQSSTTAFCLYLYGTQGGASMYTIELNRLCFNALADSAQALVQIESVGSNTDWECVDITFNKCTWGMDSNTIGFKCNTVNAKYTFFSPLAFLGVNSTFFQSNDSGWLRIVDADIRGPAGADYSCTETLQRVQAGVNLANGSHTMTITDPTTPRFTMDDLGQACTGTGLPANNYFTAITDDYHAEMYYAATSLVTGGTANIYRQNAPTGLAHASYVFNGQRGPTLIESCTDEAVCYFMLCTANTTEIFTPINLMSCSSASGRVRFEGTVIVNDFGGEWFSLSWEQSGGISPIINSFGTIPVIVTCKRGPGAFIGFRQLPTGYLYGNATNDFKKPNQIWSAQNDDFTNTPTNTVTQTQFVDRTGQFTPADNSLALGTFVTNQRDGTFTPDQNKWLLFLGTSNNVTNNIEFGYAFYRDCASGFLRITANQGAPSFEAVHFDPRVIIETFCTADTFIAETKYTTDKQYEVTGIGVTAGFNYAVGTGSTVTQITSRSTAITCNGLFNVLNLRGDSLAAGAEATCTVSNTSLASGYHIPVLSWVTGYTAGQEIFISALRNGSYDVTVRNTSGGANTTPPTIYVMWFGGSGS